MTYPGQEWRSQANCLGIDPNLFFPERGPSTIVAKGVCQGCVVKVQCLEFALSHSDKHGTWGGYSERERRDIKRERKSA